MLAKQRSVFISGDTEEVPFDGRLTPDASQVLVISPFSGAAALLTALQNPLALPLLDSGDMNSVVGLAARLPGDDDVTILQCFDGRQVLAKTGVGVLFLRNVLERLRDSGFVIRDAIDGIIVAPEPVLQFRQLSAMRRLFDMNDHYREATAGDLAHFAGLPEVIIDADVLAAVADTWIRRKIAFVVDTGMLAQRTAEELVEHAAQFGLVLASAIKGGRECIVLPRDRKGMKRVLRFLDDDYLKSEATGRQYVANSKRVLG